MWISGWGCDGAALTAEDLACLRLEEVRMVRENPGLCAAGMPQYLTQCGVGINRPYPAIETLIHAYLRAEHVDHTHPEAIIALTAVDSARSIAEKTFGDEAIWLDYVQFDPAVAQDLAAAIECRPPARFVLQANHGLLTWADTSERCYRNTLEAVQRAARALDEARTRTFDLGGEAVRALSAAQARRYLFDVLPTIRGRLSAAGVPMVLRVDPDETARSFSCSVKGPKLSLIGPACPDSLVKMRRIPALVEASSVPGGPDQRRAGVIKAIAAYADDYHAYFHRNTNEPDARPTGTGTLPRVLVVPGVGVVSAGEDAQSAALAEAHYRQTRRVITLADSVGGYSSLSEAQCWADEHWPLLRDKPQLRPPRGDLAGQVVLVVLDSGMPDPGLRDLVAGLLRADAHLVVTGTSAVPPAELEEGLAVRGVSTEIISARLVRSDDADPVRAAVLAFGGLDFVVQLSANAASGARLAEAANTVFTRQGRRGGYLATVESAERAAAVRAGVLDGAGGTGGTPRSLRAQVLVRDQTDPDSGGEATTMTSVFALMTSRDGAEA
jgi:rhamnose utilization protein RhaD (predicted bifunctional aldolase and dehydrogenase)